MARLINQGGCLSTQLSDGWVCLSTPARTAGTALLADAPASWIPARVPGTVAMALAAAGPPNPVVDLHALDHWYRLETALPGAARIEFCGLATFAEIWVDGCLIASTDTMFVPLTAIVPSAGGHRLEICFRALRPKLRERTPGRRARWRGRLTTEEGLRNHRTTLLGHMPGWSGGAPVIGPYRPIILHEPVRGAPLVDRVDLRTRLLPQGAGLLSVRLDGAGLMGRNGTLYAAGHSVPLSPTPDGLRAELTLPDPALWWPHTHGQPATIAVRAEIDGYPIDLGHTGFRTIDRRDPADGFGLIVNGIPVFARGAIWIGLDATTCPADPAALSSTLRSVCAAGLNMLRVTGMTVYETPEFFRMCDELGIMVWHDFMFTRFDYPATEAFTKAVAAEARAFLTATQAHPCLTVLCGSSEVAQTAAMSGCAPEHWRAPLFDELLAQEVASARPDVVYVPHAPLQEARGPGDSDLPFAAAASITHYFGVGAYQRPLDDLLSAGVRFAAECLAFANYPDAATYREWARTRGASSNLPSIVRDSDAAWNFGDVRDHYAETLFGICGATTRRQDPARWIDIGRATVVLIAQAALATWRTDGRCAGALVLMLQDVVPGIGWGITGNNGRPKSVWHALRSVCQPVQVLLRDLGQNGIVLHAINETETPRHVRLGLRGLLPDGAVEALGSAELDLAARDIKAVTATSLMGRWRDLANTWQFGPPSFAVLGATLDDVETGERLSEVSHFPCGPNLPRTQTDLSARLFTDLQTWKIEIFTKRFAQSIQIDDDCWLPSDEHFHLWPGESRVVQLRQYTRRSEAPTGTISALNSHSPVHYGFAA